LRADLVREESGLLRARRSTCAKFVAAMRRHCRRSAAPHCPRRCGYT
jgi:hypothetical protein